MVLNLFDKIKGMDQEELACLLARLVIDAIYNTQEAFNIEPRPMSAADVKGMVDTYKEVLSNEYFGGT